MTRKLAGAVTIAAALVLAACSSGGSDEIETTPDPGTSATASSTQSSSSENETTHEATDPPGDIDATGPVCTVLSSAEVAEALGSAVNRGAPDTSSANGLTSCIYRPDGEGLYAVVTAFTADSPITQMIEGYGSPEAARAGMESEMQAGSAEGTVQTGLVTIDGVESFWGYAVDSSGEATYSSYTLRDGILINVAVNDPTGANAVGDLGSKQAKVADLVVPRIDPEAVTAWFAE